MTRTAAALLLAAACGVHPAGLSAQACRGGPEPTGSWLAVEGRAATYTYANAYGAAVAGGRKVFGALEAGRARDADIRAVTHEAALGVGSSHGLLDERLRLCPVARLAAVFGPEDLLLSGADHRRVEGSLGLRAAWDALPVAGASAAPVAALSLHRSARTITWDGDPDRSIRYQTYVVGELGLAIGLPYRILLTPTLNVPFGFSRRPEREMPLHPLGRIHREVGFSIGAAVVLGRL